MRSQIRKSRTVFIFAFFLLTFLAHLHSASTQCQWASIEKIVAVGDLHGDYQNFVKILKGTGIVDEDLRWIGGKTHLVQIGDIMDRGPDAKKIFDLLMQLEKEAEEAGGKVHALIGNHEEMNITGIAFDYAGYVTPEQFVSFLPEKFREKKENELRKTMGEKAFQMTESELSSDASWRRYWEQIIKNDREARREYLSNFNERYGKWILEQNAVIKINDIVFVHGGISEKFSTWKLEDINNRLREELNAFRQAAENSELPRISRLEIVYVRDGPLWYRDLALREENIFKSQVASILSNLKAQSMVIAHTPRIVLSMNDMRRFEGRIWIVDTGISKVYGGHLRALIIANGNFSVWGINNEN